MTWNDARKLMQQENVFAARKSWVGTGFGCVYYDANEKIFRNVGACKKYLDDELEKED